MERGKLFYFSRFFIRLGIGRWTAAVESPDGPAVYVCSHRNLSGPLATLCWLPFAPRPWVLHVFLERESCRKQYRDYTFPGASECRVRWHRSPPGRRPAMSAD